MRRGAAYTLPDGLRLWDHDSGCGQCGKRLAEVVHDPTNQWNAGRVVCIDCGTVAPAYDKPKTAVLRSRVASGKHVAACQLCSYMSMPTDLARAYEYAAQHLAAKHGAAA
jgi:hypothetical protein